ncbi:hypothetical protein [Ferrovibrio sp.]|uniref:hypothetical protein n=1 Tax=Ferrovibrio sp. TaxID=1917215 RepID=UPI003D27F97D
MTEASPPGPPATASGAVGQTRTGTDPAILTNQHVLDFYDLWLSRCPPGCLPAKAAMDPLLMGRFLSTLLLLKVHRDPLDFEYRIIGEEVIALLGNMTGKRVGGSAMINLAGSAYANYSWVVEHRVPQFLEGPAITAFRKERTYVMSRVHCPLAEDGQTVDHIISCVAFL